MFISDYYDVDVVNGQGTRVSLFVSGCIHKCKGCHNKPSWNRYNGIEYSHELENRIIDDLNNTTIIRRGLTLSGGDPLYLNNLDTIINLIKRVKNECLNKDIWLWSGYTLENIIENSKSNKEEDLKRLEIIKLVDIFIDGKFEKEKYDPDLLWRGSSNQKIIDIKNCQKLKS